MNNFFRVVYFDTSGLRDDSKRRLVVESSLRGRDVLRLSKTHLFWPGIAECGSGNKGKVEASKRWSSVDRFRRN